MRPKEILWCSPRRLPAKDNPQISLAQFSDLEALIAYLEEGTSESTSSSATPSAEGIDNSVWVVLDASQGGAFWFHDYEVLRQKFPKLEVSMVYSTVFDPEEIWQSILGVVKPGVVVSAPSITIDSAPVAIRKVDREIKSDKTE